MIKLTLRKKIFHTVGFTVFSVIGLIALLIGEPLGGLVLGFSIVKYIDLLKNGDNGLI